MKNLIIIIGSIILGLYIFNLLVGEGDSVKNSVEEVMKHRIEIME